MKKIYTALIFMLAISVNSSSAKENEGDVSNHLSSPGNSVPATSSLSQGLDEIEGDDIGSRSSVSLSTLDEDSVSLTPLDSAREKLKLAMKNYKGEGMDHPNYERAIAGFKDILQLPLSKRNEDFKIHARYLLAMSERKEQNFSAAREGFKSLINDLDNNYRKSVEAVNYIMLCVELSYESKLALLDMDVKGEGVTQNVALTQALAKGNLFFLNAKMLYHPHRRTIQRGLTFIALTIIFCGEYPKLGAAFAAILAADFVRCHVL